MARTRASLLPTFLGVGCCFSFQAFASMKFQKEALGGLAQRSKPRWEEAIRLKYCQCR